ncbi:MAG: hypothetical protein KJ985_09385, partial [Proteobacteria bacterium]|nr:hypothetical protein [Pseudomonadota bacterium]
MMSGCLYEQKRIIDPAAPVAPEQAQSGSAGQLIDSTGTGDNQQNSFKSNHFYIHIHIHIYTFLLKYHNNQEKYCPLRLTPLMLNARI